MGLEKLAILGGNGPPIAQRGLEWLLTSPDGFGITTATPVQRAACRVREGKPLGELATDPDVIWALGGEQAIEALETCGRPFEVCEVASPRTAKTIRACALALLATQTVDVSGLGPGEIPLVSIVSLKLKVTSTPFKILVETVKASPTLRPLLISDGKDSAMFRHPSGREIEVACVAGAAAGAGLISRWSAGVIFDEAPRMHGQEDGIVNLDDAISAVVDRLLPGAQIQYIGSPWAPFGPVFKMVQEHHGKPTEDLVVIRMTGPMGNPKHWTPELQARLERRDRNAWLVGVKNEFVDVATAMFTLTDVQPCAVLDGDIPPDPLISYVAVIDPATRRNAWTLVILGNYGERIKVVLTREWVPKPGIPLSAKATLFEIAQLVVPYGLHAVHTDQWSADALNEHAQAAGIVLLDHSVTGPDRVDQCKSILVRLREKTLDLPKDPVFLLDLRRVVQMVTRQGISIEFAKSQDGRHCDYAAALALGILLPMGSPKKAPDAPHEKDYATARKAELARTIARQQRRRIVQMPH